MKRIAHHRPSSRGHIARLAFCCALAAPVVPAAAAGGDSRLGLVLAAAASATGQRLWQIQEFTRIELAPREPGAQPNGHPVVVAPDLLRQRLEAVLVTQDGSQQPLFASDELRAIVGPLAQALAAARADDDLLLVSASRRGGILTKPTAVTARLFVQDGRLQLLVRDTRLDFYDSYRGTSVASRFEFGSRSAAGRVSLQAAAGDTSRRADWLSLALVAAAATTPAANVVTAPTPTPATTPTPSATAPAATSDAERRLETLKRLRERDLITEDEYRQKRAEILKAL